MYVSNYVALKEIKHPIEMEEKQLLISVRIQF